MRVRNLIKIVTPKSRKYGKLLTVSEFLGLFYLLCNDERKIEEATNAMAIFLNASSYKETTITKAFERR